MKADGLDCRLFTVAVAFVREGKSMKTVVSANRNFFRQPGAFTCYVKMQQVS